MKKWFTLCMAVLLLLGVFAGWLQVQFPWGIFENFM